MRMKKHHIVTAMSIYAHLPNEFPEFVFNSSINMLDSLSSMLKIKQLQSPINISDYLNFH